MNTYYDGLVCLEINFVWVGWIQMYLFKCIIEFAHMQRGKDFSNPGLSGKPQAEPKSAVSHNPAEKLPLSENNWILFNEIKLKKTEQIKRPVSLPKSSYVQRWANNSVFE